MQGSEEGKKALQTGGGGTKQQTAAQKALEDVRSGKARDAGFNLPSDSTNLDPYKQSQADKNKVSKIMAENGQGLEEGEQAIFIAGAKITQKSIKGAAALAELERQKASAIVGGQQVATEKGKSQHYMRKPEPVWLDHLDKRGSDAASKEREADMPKAP